MQYLLLLYRNEAFEIDHSDPTYEAHLARYTDLIEEIKANGHYVGAEPLQSVSTATTLRKRDGKLSMTDGPFAETKEQLAGYFLVDCPDLDCAMDYASRIPIVEVGSVEIRPLLDIAALRKS